MLQLASEGEQVPVVDWDPCLDLLEELLADLDLVSVVVVPVAGQEEVRELVPELEPVVELEPVPEEAQVEGPEAEVVVEPVEDWDQCLDHWEECSVVAVEVVPAEEVQVDPVAEPEVASDQCSDHLEVFWVVAEEEVAEVPKVEVERAPPLEVEAVVQAANTSTKSRPRVKELIYNNDSHCVPSTILYKDCNKYTCTVYCLRSMSNQ